MATPTRATKYRKTITSARRQLDTRVKKHSPEEELAIFVEGDFTRRQWEIIQGANETIDPCYSRIKDAKRECYPPEESMRVIETCAEIQLQALIDHTATRICKYALEVINTTCPNEEKQRMQLLMGLRWIVAVTVQTDVPKYRQ
ncbi:hypothetical protein MML48_9g00015139 [Holotrichia oblita]|uniref:Uncharacterized protein n=1 Tax=Holotrichia oblita TaxID=644536 RepID=A0ACB9SJU7_HOLOL|nr:hypothetical protein MML48_9g00015139 [Holotrichia oblita]